MDINVNTTVSFDLEKFTALLQYLDEINWISEIGYYDDPEGKHKEIEADYFEQRMWKWITECNGTMVFTIWDDMKEGYRRVLIDSSSLRSRLMDVANKAPAEFLKLGTGGDDLYVCDELLQIFFYGAVTWA